MLTIDDNVNFKSVTIHIIISYDKTSVEKLWTLKVHMTVTYLRLRYPAKAESKKTALKTHAEAYSSILFQVSLCNYGPSISLVNYGRQID